MSQVLHLVMWKLKGDTAADKAAHALTLKIAFRGMQHHLPGLLEVNAGANEVRGEGAFDFAISMRFASWADLKAYNIHPAHEDIKHMMREIRTERASVDFELPGLRKPDDQQNCRQRSASHRSGS